VTATGEVFGYYADYKDHSRAVGKALAQGFVYQGQEMPYSGRARGKPSGALPATAFVSFIQNHDQIGNRALGDRVLSSLPIEVTRAVSAIYLLSPQIPMIFMGEEWNSRRPFPSFCDFDPALNENVRNGRRKELARLPGFDAEELLDPAIQETFDAAKLDWTNLQQTLGTDQIAFYRGILEARRKYVVPLLESLKLESGRFECRKDGLISVTWPLTDGRRLSLLCNLSKEQVDESHQDEIWEEIFRLGMIANRSLGRWSVLWRILP